MIWSNWDQTIIYSQATDAEQPGEDEDKGGVQFSLVQDGMIKVIKNVINTDWFKETWIYIYVNMNNFQHTVCIFWPFYILVTRCLDW